MARHSNSFTFVSLIGRENLCSVWVLAGFLWQDFGLPSIRYFSLFSLVQKFNTAVSYLTFKGIEKVGDILEKYLECVNFVLIVTQSNHSSSTCVLR